METVGVNRVRAVMVVALVVVGMVTAGAGSASAEWFVDVFAGVTTTGNRDIEFGDDRFYDVTYKGSFSVGGRGGYWFEDLPFIGLAVDGFRFRPDIGPQNVNSLLQGPIRLGSTTIGMTGFGLEILLRMPLLQDREFPAGRLQPYLGFGPTLFLMTVDDTSNFSPPADQSKTRPSIGFQAMAGIAWQFHQHVAIFGEYRVTQFHSDIDFGRVTARTTATFDILSSHFLGGVSFRF